MGEGDLQNNGNKGYRRPGEMPWPSESNQGDNTQPPAQKTTSTDAEIHSMYGRSGIQNSEGQTKPPIRFMEGALDPNVPNTKGRVWTETDGQGHITRVHGRPHWQLPAPMSQDKSATMEDNERAAEERKNKVPSVVSLEDTAKKHADNRRAAMEQEICIRNYTDWAPNVINNDWMGGLGGAAAALIFAPGPTKAATMARMVKGFAAGSICTSALQAGPGDQIDKHLFKHDHGWEWKWFSDGVVIPATFWTAAKSGQVTRSIMGSSMLGKSMTALSIGLPVVLGMASSVVAHGADKATGAEDRNPTYSNWCQQAFWDSAATTLVGGAVYSKFGKIPAIGAMLGTWALARQWNNLNPYPTPAKEFDKSLLALDKFQTERTAASMEDAIGHLREFGNFGRTGAMKNPWDWQHPLEIPGNLCNHYAEQMKMRVNANSTAPELYKFATIFPDSQHNKGGYAGSIAHALVNFEAGQRALKWGAVGVEMPLGDSLGQDMKVDLGGEAMRKFILARQEVDMCIEYAKKHDGEVLPGDVSGKPINAEAEVKMLTELGDRIDHALSEITGAHEKLDQVIDQVKNRLWTGNFAPVNELCADVRERAMYPRLKHPTLTPMLQAKLMRDAAMIDLARAEVMIEGQMKFHANAKGESHQQIAFLTSEMPKLALYFGDSLRSLTWARTKMDKDDPALADLDHIAQRAYVLYQRAKQVGIPETMVMGGHLKDFAEGKLIDIAPNYENDAVNRAAIRNGRNPIKDELDDYAAPAQKTQAQVEQNKAAQVESDRRNNAAQEEGTQLQEQNATMQQAEIDMANRREAFARQHIQEEIQKFTAHTGRQPTAAEIEGIVDSLMEVAPTEPTQQLNSNPNPTPDSAQQQTPNAGQPSQPSTAQGNPVDARREFDARVKQFRIENNGRVPTAAQMKDLAQGLPLDHFKASQSTNPTPYVTPQAPQEALPVIHQSAPDQ